MKRVIRTGLVAALLAASAPALATEPVTLSDRELDGVAAGFFGGSLASLLSSRLNLFGSPGDKSGGGPLGVSGMDLGSGRIIAIIRGLSGTDLGSGR
jgi:hypothetical protein